MVEKAQNPRFTSSLSFRLFLGLVSTIFVLFFAYSAFLTHLQGEAVEDQLSASANRTGDIIRQSLFTGMLRNERELTHSIITLVGTEPGVEGVRIYNKEGRIMFSSDSAETGRAVDLEAEACFACHALAQPLSAVPTPERSRLYRHEDGHRVMGVIIPIRNEESCWNSGCHAHRPDQTFLGVLDVQMSLASADSALAQSRRRASFLTLASILLASFFMAIIVYRAVHLPARKLRAGTLALANGDLDYRIDMDRTDELGALAQSFNLMAQNLRSADTELRAWSLTLEERVHEKTEELEAANRQMVQAEKASSLGKMAATVAHELNNPLSGILTTAKLLERKIHRLLPEGEDRDRVAENLDLIRGESARCGNIVRDLLTYARESRPQFQECRLHEIIRRALRLVEHHTRVAEVETETGLLLRDDRIVCDGEQITQILIALMVNAVEAMPSGGRLRLQSWDDPTVGSGKIYLSVNDNGIGIPEEIRDRVFDPFFSTKNEAKGVGLGLAVVYGIVQQHGGRIRIESDSESGTTITLELLRRAPEPAPRSDSTIISEILVNEKS